MKQTFYYKSFKWNIILGILWLLIGIVYLVDRGFSNVLAYGYLALGLVWFMPYFKNGKRRAITFFDDRIILHNQSDIFNKKILLNDIELIQNRHILIRIITKSGYEYDIQKDEFDGEELAKLEDFIETNPFLKTQS